MCDQLAPDKVTVIFLQNARKTFDAKLARIELATLRNTRRGWRGGGAAVLAIDGSGWRAVHSTLQSSTRDISSFATFEGV